MVQSSRAIKPRRSIAKSEFAPGGSRRSGYACFAPTKHCGAHREPPVKPLKELHARRTHTARTYAHVHPQPNSVQKYMANTKM